MAAPPPAPRPTRRPGHTFGVMFVGIVIGALTAVFSGQILRDTFAPRSEPLLTDCPESIRGLWTALQRARRSAASTVGEQPALTAFRSQLEPEWGKLVSIERGCAERQEWAEAVRTLSQLRFDEEHAVRYEARSIAVRRDKAEQLVRALR